MYCSDVERLSPCENENSLETSNFYHIGKRLGNWNDNENLLKIYEKSCIRLCHRLIKIKQWKSWNLWWIPNSTLMEQIIMGIKIQTTVYTPTAEGNPILLFLHLYTNTMATYLWSDVHLNLRCENVREGQVLMITWKNKRLKTKHKTQRNLAE